MLKNLIKQLMFLIISTVFATIIHADTNRIQNKTSNYYVLTNTSDENNKANYTKILQQNAIQKITEPKELVLEYDVCHAVDGDACRNLLGHFGIKFTATGIAVINSTGGKVEVGSLPAESSAISITFTPTKTIQFATPQKYTGVNYRGFNLAGSEFEPPPQIPPPGSADYFVGVGANTVRIPFRWEYMQSDPHKDIDFNQEYTKQVIALVTALADRGLYVILDMHNYMRYPVENGNWGKKIGEDSAATREDYARTWAQLATKFRSGKYASLVLFDLMNEPHDMRAQTVLANENAAIAAIRATGATNMILVEGNHWSGLHSWTTEGDQEANSKIFTRDNIHDSRNNYAINVHQYFNQDWSGENTTCVHAVTSDEMHFADFVQYMKNNKVPVFVTELGGIEDNNCGNIINGFLQQVGQNAYIPAAGYGFLGWTGWSGGSFPEWYDLVLNPHNGKERLQMILGFKPNLLPAPGI